MPNGFSQLYQLDESISILGLLDVAFHFYTNFDRAFSINSGDPDCAASDLGPQCLTMSHKKDAMLIWVIASRETFDNKIKSHEPNSRWCILQRFAGSIVHESFMHMDQDETNMCLEHKPVSCEEKELKIIHGRTAKSYETVTFLPCTNAAGQKICPSSLSKAKSPALLGHTVYKKGQLTPCGPTKTRTLLMKKETSVSQKKYEPLRGYIFQT